MIKHFNGHILDAPAKFRCYQVSCKGELDPVVIKLYPELAKKYREICEMYGTQNMGTVQFYETRNETIVANCFAQENDGEVDYLAFIDCIKTLLKEVKMSRIPIAFEEYVGCEGGKGDWPTILAILQDAFGSLDGPICYICHRRNGTEWPTTVRGSKAYKQSPEKAAPISLPTNKVILYTDGACSGNPGPGGWAAVLRSGNVEKEISGGYGSTTNNRMEMMAVIKGLELLDKRCTVDLYSDSKYVIDALEKGWAESWKKNGWKKSNGKLALNIDLWKQLLELCHKHRVRPHWVKGHSTDKYNQRCDQLAVQAYRRFL